MYSLISSTISILLANIALLCKNYSHWQFSINVGYVLQTVAWIGSLKYDIKNFGGI